MHLAVKAGFWRTVDFLLDKAPELASDESLAKDNSGMTPLHLAAFNMALEIVRLLLAKAPELVSNESLAKNNNGMTPLDIVCCENLEAVRIITKAMPRPMLEKIKRIPNPQAKRIIQEELDLPARPIDTAI